MSDDRREQYHRDPWRAVVDLRNLVCDQREALGAELADEVQELCDGLMTGLVQRHEARGKLQALARWA